MSQSALAARNPRLLAGPLMRNALGVRRFAAPAGDLAQSGSIEQCESSEMFGGHGVLVIHGLSLATRLTRRHGRRQADAFSSHPLRDGVCCKGRATRFVEDLARLRTIADGL